MEYNAPPIETKKGMNQKVEQPQKTFFFEREDKTIFSVNEEAAWNIITGKNQIVGRRTYPPKLIGTSDGTIFFRMLQEAKDIFKEKGIDAAQEHIRQAHEAELEEAKKHIERPRNFDTIGNNGQPVRIADLQ